MPVAYLLNTPAEQIAAHIRMADALKAGAPVIEFIDDPGADIPRIRVSCTSASRRPCVTHTSPAPDSAMVRLSSSQSA